MHGVLNVVKRIMIILMCAVLLGRPLNTLQLMGIVVANAAAVAYAMLEAAGPTQPGGGSRIQGLTLPAACGAARTAAVADDRGRVQKGSRGSLSGGVPLSPSTTLSRLVTVVGATLITSALFIAYVIACLHSSVVVQQRQQQQQLQLTQPQHQLQPQQQQIQIRLPPEGLWEPTAAAMWPGLTTGVTGPLMAANISMLGVPDYVERFLVRDMGRVQCLRALHEASKVS